MTNDLARFFGPSIDAVGSEAAIQEVLLTAGTVSNLRINLIDGGPGTGDSYVFTVRRDPAGAAGPESTGITCTVSGSATTCEDTTHSQAFAAGDAISIMATDGNTSPTGRDVFFRLNFQS